MFVNFPRRLFSFVKEVGRGFYAVQTPYLAASIAYFVVLSLIPFILLVISVSGFIAQDVETEFSKQIIRLVQSNAPTLKEAIQKYLEFATKHKQLLGIIGILGLLWASAKVIFSLNFGLDRIMMVTIQKPILSRWLDTLIMLVITILLFSFSMCLMIAASYINVIPISGKIPQFMWQAIGGFFPYGVSVIVSIALFYAIYRIIPTEKPRPRLALTGAAVGAIIWQVVNGFFSWYLMKQTLYYEVLYGSVAAFIYIILWAYLFALSILIGGSVIKVISKGGKYV